MVLRTQKHYLQGSKRSQIVLASLLLVTLIIVGLVLWVVYSGENLEPEIDANTIEDKSQIDTENADEPLSAEIVKVKSFNNQSLQSAVDLWLSNLNPDDKASIVIMDLNGTMLASTTPNQQYFGASLYKLFVAYEGYKLIDNGQEIPSEIYSGSRTRADCLDLMIRESDSPCSEKMLSEIGRSELTKIIKSYGIENTDMSNLNTTANDAAQILKRIVAGEDISKESQLAYLESMKTQIFRDALNRGFSESVIVYNKIGFNEYDEYHDVALIELSDGRKVIVSVLTVGVGTSNIAKLGASLEIALGL